jgi:hypothetical protein
MGQFVRLRTLVFSHCRSQSSIIPKDSATAFQRRSGQIRLLGETCFLADAQTCHQSQKVLQLPWRQSFQWFALVGHSHEKRFRKSPKTHRQPAGWCDVWRSMIPAIILCLHCRHRLGERCSPNCTRMSQSSLFGVPKFLMSLSMKKARMPHFTSEFRTLL